MAKKTKIETTTELINVESELAANTELLVTHSTKPKDEIDSLTIMELVYLEQSVKSVCQRYENSIKNYDGSIAHNSIEYKKFRTYNDLHHKILNKMEEKLLTFV